MDSFTLVDGIVAAIVVVSGLLAYARGLTRELLAIIGWIAAALLAFIFAETAMPLVKNLPVIGEEIADSCEIAIILSFALVFAVALVVISVFTPLFSSLVQRSAIGPVDQGLGFLFGVARGILLVAVAFFVYSVVLQARDVPMVDNSRSAAVFSGLVAKFQNEDPSAALEWLTVKYESLVSACAQ